MEPVAQTAWKKKARLAVHVTLWDRALSSFPFCSEARAPRWPDNKGKHPRGRGARTGPLTLDFWKRTSVSVYLLHSVTVNHVRHERDIPVQEGGRSQVQWNLVCHHHCDVHSWRNSLNCPTWKSREKEGRLAQQGFRKTCLHKKGTKIDM